MQMNMLVIRDHWQGNLDYKGREYEKGCEVISFINFTRHMIPGKRVLSMKTFSTDAEKQSYGQDEVKQER
jgi:hypothetical protein